MSFSLTRSWRERGFVIGQLHFPGSFRCSITRVLQHLPQQKPLIPKNAVEALCGSLEESCRTGCPALLYFT